MAIPYFIALYSFIMFIAVCLFLLFVFLNIYLFGCVRSYLQHTDSLLWCMGF